MEQPVASTSAVPASAPRQPRLIRRGAGRGGFARRPRAALDEDAQMADSPSVEPAAKKMRSTASKRSDNGLKVKQRFLTFLLTLPSRHFGQMNPFRSDLR